MGVEPDDGEPLVPGGEPFDGAHVRAAAPAEDERPLGQFRRERERLLAQRLLLDHRRLGIRERQARRLGHRVAAVTPGARHPDEAGAEDAPTSMALVLRPERDRGESAAVGALRSKSAHGFRS